MHDIYSKLLKSVCAALFEAAFECIHLALFNRSFTTNAFNDQCTFISIVAVVKVVVIVVVDVNKGSNTRRSTCGRKRAAEPSKQVIVTRAFTYICARIHGLFSAHAPAQARTHCCARTKGIDEYTRKMRNDKVSYSFHP